MYAIVDIKGQQFRVEKDRKIYVHRLEDKEGSKVSFDRILLVDNNGKIEVGTPVVSDFYVSAKVLSHVKGDKVKVFKKKKRKGYQKLNGHRQQFTEILIEDILKGKAPVKIVEKPTTEKKTGTKADVIKQPVVKQKETVAEKTETKEKAVATEKTTTAKTASAAKPKKAETAQKKPAAKKTTTAKPKATATKKTTAAKPKTNTTKKTTTKSKATGQKSGGSDNNKKPEK